MNILEQKIMCETPPCVNIEKCKQKLTEKIKVLDSNKLANVSSIIDRIVYAQKTVTQILCSVCINLLVFIMLLTCYLYSLKRKRKKKLLRINIFRRILIL